MQELWKGFEGLGHKIGSLTFWEIMALLTIWGLSQVISGFISAVWKDIKIGWELGGNKQDGKDL